VTLKEAKDFVFIGKHVPRTDSKAKSNGTAQFTQDVKLPDMLTAVVAHPTRFGARLHVAELPLARRDYDEVPVLLRNPAWLRPFELLLGLVGPPRYGSIDPTPFLAVFFPLFFGLVLGDIGFGLVLFALALLARRRGWGGELGRRAAQVAVVCATSAILCGAFFGEVFGELGAPLGIHPLVIDRRVAFMPLLGVTVALGAVQVLLAPGANS
jgi:V/A-type H+-transporting ATPase subunit I